MFNKLEEIIKKVEGNVLSVCLDSKLIEYFKKNNKIDLYMIESDSTSSFFRKRSKKKTNRGKNINIKKLRKYINKKSVDYLFCNMNDIFPFYKYFIKDSVHLNNNKLYIYADNKINKELLIKNYSRYKVKIDELEYKNGFILIIDNTKSKTNFIKDFFYFIKDTIFNLAEAIGNLLIS